MKWLHSATITVFAKPAEDKDAIKKALRELIPFPLEEQKITLEEETIEHTDGTMTIYRIHLKKEAHTTRFLKTLFDTLGKEQSKLIKKQEDRLHEDERDFNFYIRLEKNALLTNHEWKLTESGDCIHIKLQLAAFPKKRETALSLIHKMFEQFG